MPSPFTSTFASAAASTNGDNRRDNTGTSEWYGKETQLTNVYVPHELP